MEKPNNIELLDMLITGRVEPHIYAFSTNTIPDYLKIGDTYRPVSVRLKEWEKYFPNLQKEYDETAAINNEVFFRDYSVHQYLERDLRKHRLESSECTDFYYSNEFFKGVLIEEVSEAIVDIRENYAENTGKYKYYDANSMLPETYTYNSTGMWELRPNQKDTVERFVRAIKMGRTNLLMYAVMRFGKSFTALCCAKEMNAKLVLVVSAKADVREEWKKTVQSADNFNKEYSFLTSEDLLRNPQAITSTLEEGKKVVVFLTLQDLQGDSIKDKHKEVFGQEIDLLIVDETHYGARAGHYGEVIRNVHYKTNFDDNDIHADEDFVDIFEAEEQLKSLSVWVTLHLSGTPYRILMGSEFEKEDIIAFYQFSDIVDEMEKWNREHLFKEENINGSEAIEIKEEKEWDNPYFGFPQMIRFAFNLNQSSLAILDSIKNGKITYKFSELLKPVSIKKDTETNQHKKFQHEKEVLELFEAIDGTKDEDGIFSFLDYDRIREGKLCQHMVCVLPYCASCDALEELIKRNNDKFRNLQSYTIINISGVDSPDEYRNVSEVKAKIKQCVEEGKKTLTLTVNRMLTGSTVEEWDTMIFLKDTASPQEYDQAIFRLQNQYVKEYAGKNGDVIKYNMKPQTLLVDFDPHRMFVMQEMKSQIYNANTDASGNEHLRDRMERELQISPIIKMNCHKLEQVEAADILTEISNYSGDRGVMDEAEEIPVDMSLLEWKEIRTTIEVQAELGDKRQGLSIDAHNGEESDAGNPNDFDVFGDVDSGNTESDDYGDSNEDGNVGGKEKEVDTDSLEKKFRTYYTRILFFAFLTKSEVASLEDILECIDKGENCRVSANLGLSMKVLTLMKEHMNIFVLRQLDYKIQNLNMLSKDDSVDQMKRASVAIRKFGRISDSEITTPEWLAEEMISLIPDDCFKSLTDSGARIIDVASKMGEFAVAIVKRCGKMNIAIKDIRNKILSIPTSTVAYEFTHKIYEILGLDTDAIVEEFNSYDLLRKGISLSEVSGNLGEGSHKMKFNAVVGNPPYQEADGGASASSKPIYPYFVDASRELNPSYVSIIIPSRWYTGGKHLDEFRNSMLEDVHIRELHDCLHPEEIFPETNNRGGVCYFLWDQRYDNVSNQMKVVTHNGNGEITEAVRDMKTKEWNIFIRDSNAIPILDKVISDGKEKTMRDYISARKPFGIGSNIIKTPEWHTNPNEIENPVQCLGKGQKRGYLSKEKVTSNKEYIDKWKVFTPRANNVGTELNDDNLNTIIGMPGLICTEAYIMIGCGLELNQDSALNLANYFKTKFVRFMHGLAKSSHDASRSTYRFVPVVDFSENWTDEKLYAKFGLTQDEIELIEKSIKPME